MKYSLKVSRICIETILIQRRQSASKAEILKARLEERKEFRDSISRMAYRYETLTSREIRIFVLDMSSLGSRIRGAFVRQSIGGPGQYDALSYVWGEEQRIEIVLCEDKILRVTTSLYKALEAYKRASDWTSTEFPIWADAICIN